MLGHFCIPGAFSNSHRPPQTILGVCIQNFFRVSTLYKVGEGVSCKKILKRMHCFLREPRMTEKYECCFTVPRAFVLIVGKDQGHPTTVSS